MEVEQVKWWDKVKWNTIHHAIKPCFLYAIGYAYRSFCDVQGKEEIKDEIISSFENKKLYTFKKILFKRLEEMNHPTLTQGGEILILLLKRDGYYLEQFFKVLDDYALDKDENFDYIDKKYKLKKKDD